MENKKRKLDNNPQLTEASIHPDLIVTTEEVFRYFDWNQLDWDVEKQNSEYGAYLIKLDHLLIRFRVAKTTPTKVGQFVTLWKRNVKGIIEPYTSQDKMDFVVINTRLGEHIGQFVFPKKVLIEKGILSVNGVGGKRGFRVYPLWDQPDNPQAIQTQKWQLNYFLDLTQGSQQLNAKSIQRLYNI